MYHKTLDTDPRTNNYADTSFERLQVDFGCATRQHGMRDVEYNKAEQGGEPSRQKCKVMVREKRIGRVQQLMDWYPVTSYYLRPRLPVTFRQWCLGPTNVLTPIRETRRAKITAFSIQNEKFLIFTIWKALGVCWYSTSDSSGIPHSRLLICWSLLSVFFSRTYSIRSLA